MKEVSLGRLAEITEEVFYLGGSVDTFDFLNGHPDTAALERRLQEVMMTRQSFESIELAMYLRSSYVSSYRLPTWQPLLNAAVEMSNMRGDPTNDIFYGMIEQRPDPFRNTGYPK